MNMKKTIYTVIATLLFLISSCTLEQEVYNKINPGMFPQNAEDVNALVNSSAYYVFSPWGIFEVAAGYVTTSEMVTDYVENTWGWTTVYNSYEANDWHIDGDYRRVYDYSQYLASMTLTMERIKNVDMDETLKARYMAELKCGRGFLAFLMYDMYGPIPIADLETLQKPEAEIVIPRLSEEAMREYIVTNLKEAADILPYKYEDTDYGRFTKGLANTLLLKFYMMTKQWDEAEKIGRELTKSEYGYKLVDDYHSLFSLSGEKNSEVIFSIFFCDIFTNIVTSLTCSCVTFTADIPAGFFLLFILIKTFRCTDCQITIFQFCSNFIFLEPWKINLKFISIFHFLDICLHQIIRMMSIELLFCSVLCFICISVKRKSKPIIIK